MGRAAGQRGRRGHHVGAHTDGCTDDTARRLSCHGRTAVRPRASALLRLAVQRAPGRRDLSAGAAKPAGNAGTTRAVRVVHDAVLRPPRRPPRLDEAAAPRRPPQHQHADGRHDRQGHGIRLDWRLAAGRSAGHLPRQPGQGERAAERDRLQQQSVRQPRLRNDDWQLPGWRHARPDPDGQRLVVPRSEERHRSAARRTVRRRAPLDLRRHGHRLTVVHVAAATRILPPGSLQPARSGNGPRRAAL